MTIKSGPRPEKKTPPMALPIGIFKIEMSVFSFSTIFFEILFCRMLIIGMFAWSAVMLPL